jgi:tRNA 2-selenouridine synthase
MDVRAPIEFQTGAFPHSKNIPLLDNEQRQLIGIRFKEQGQDAAIALGLELATPAIKNERLQHWQEFCNKHPLGYLYCFRGGLRSHTTQKWLSEVGCDYPLVIGGYKAMRRYLLDVYQSELNTLPLIALSGATGTGKTSFLHRYKRHLDLEYHAKHRGSAFGKTLSDQPTQINWENILAVNILHLSAANHSLPVLVEDESRLIGRVHLPEELQARLKASPIVVLEAPFNERIENIYSEYVEADLRNFQLHYANEAQLSETDYDSAKSLALREYRQQTLSSLSRIRRRLGGERYERIYKLFSEGLKSLPLLDKLPLCQGITLLLQEYYDPLYNWQLNQRAGLVILRGYADEIYTQINQRYPELAS